MGPEAALEGARDPAVEAEAGRGLEWESGLVVGWAAA